MAEVDLKIFRKVLADNPSEEEFLYWRRMLTIYIEQAKTPAESKLPVLFSVCSPKAFFLIDDASTFDEAITRLDNKFSRKGTDLMMRYKLRTRRQQEGESIDAFMADLKALANKCHFGALTAEQHRESLICDAFVSGLSSTSVRQRLLESSDSTLATLFRLATTLEVAMDESRQLCRDHPTIPSVNFAATTVENHHQSAGPSSLSQFSNSAATKSVCFWCGGKSHPRSSCPAKDSTCRNCQKSGHWASVCRAKRRMTTATAATRGVSGDDDLSIASILAAIERASSIIQVRLNGITTQALLDTGSEKSFVTEKFLEDNRVEFNRSNRSNVCLADNSRLPVSGTCKGHIEFGENKYACSLIACSSLVAPVIVGMDILSQHQSLTLKFINGIRPPASVRLASLTSVNSEPMSLLPGVAIENLSPIAFPSRQKLKEDEFVTAKIKRLLKDGIIQPSRSSWRAPCFVCRQGSKPRLVIDYSKTINNITPLDAYPMVNI